jgi:hypothetical protein
MDHSAIIKHYQNNRVGCVRDDKVIIYCKTSPDIETAIRRAAMARNKNGQKHSHQSRYISDEILERLAEKMLTKKNEIMSVKNFDELFEIITNTYVFSSKDSLTFYDTALRLGFYLNKLPEKIYIHAGARKGAEKIRGGKIENHFLMKRYLPEPFKSCDLTEYELEDLFCVYKDEL